MTNGRVNLKDILVQAKTDDKNAIESLFHGFLSEGETATDCGYLGTMGFIFAEHSFWCVTPLRVCSLRIKRGGEMVFNSGYIEHVNSDAFYQPSLFLLWLLLALIAVSTFGVGLLLSPWIIKAFYKMKKSGVVFWVAQGIPVYVFADRGNLTKAQRLATQIATSKRHYSR